MTENCLPDGGDTESGRTRGTPVGRCPDSSEEGRAMGSSRSYLVGALIAVVGWTGVAGAAPAKVYVADEEANTVSVIDAVALSRVAVIPVGRDPHNVQVSPDGRFAWVTNNGERPKEDEAKHKAMERREHEAMGSAGEVWAIDIATDTVVAKVSVGRHPAHVV